MLGVLSRRAFWSTVALASLAGLLYLLFLGRGFTYGFDEWVFVAHRSSWSLDAVFLPHNGHISVLAAAVYLLVFQTVGLNHPEIFRVLVLALHVGCAVCVGLLVARRHGRAIAAWAALVVMFLGKGAQNILWGFQIGLTGSVFFFLLTMVMIDRWEEEPRRSRLVWAGAALTASILLSSVGLPAIIAVAVYVLCSRQRRHLWWVPVPSMMVYAVWYAGYADNPRVPFNPALSMRWMWAAVCDAHAAFVNGGGRVGGVLAVALAAWIVHRATRRALPLRLVAWITFPFAFWALTAMLRYSFPAGASRYLHVAMIALVLVVSEVCPDVRSREARRHGWHATAVACAALVSIVLQFPSFRATNALMRDYFFTAPSARGTLSVIELLGHRIDPSTRIAGIPDNPFITVGEYLTAVRATGSSAAIPPLALPGAKRTVREGADYFLNASRAVTVRADADEGCSPNPATQSITVTGGGSVRIRSTGANGVVVRRFVTDGPTYDAPRELSAGSSTISVPGDALDVPWVLLFSAPVEQLSCPGS